MREGNSVQITESVMKHPSVFDTSRIKNTSSGKFFPLIIFNFLLLSDEIYFYNNSTG
jgi:hypothetical protein